jgi:hypothetical protein
MDLYNILNNDSELLDEFCITLATKMSIKIGYMPMVYFTKTENCLYFFFDNSSILQIIPHEQYQYTYANVPQFQNEIRDAIIVIEKKFNRDNKIDIILRE